MAAIIICVLLAIVVSGAYSAVANPDYSVLSDVVGIVVLFVIVAVVAWVLIMAVAGNFMDGEKSTLKSSGKNDWWGHDDDDVYDAAVEATEYRDPHEH